MATYLELRNLFDDSDIRNRVESAIVIAANNLLQGTPTANDRAWIVSVIGNYKAEGRKAFMLVLAANKDLTLVNIQNATDTAIQTQVDAIVPELVLALAGV